MIDRDFCKDFRTAFEKFAEEFGKANNCVIELGAINFNSLAGTFKANVSGVEADSGDKESAMEREFYNYCRYFGLEKSDYLAEFKYNGDSWQIIGLQPNRRTYPIVARNKRNGDERLFTQTIVRHIIRDEEDED